MMKTTLKSGLWLCVFLVGSGIALAGPQEDYYRAYYLQTEKGDLDEALRLFNKVAKSAKVDPAIAADAALRARCCREDVRSRNFAQLMPPDSLAYVELRSPGEHLTRLLEQLGLVRSDGWMLPDKIKEKMKRFAVSPALLSELSSFRGLAVAVTGFDPVKQMPHFVAVLHPGDNEILRGVLETAVPAAGEPVNPIRRTRAFKIEDVYVALTPRLVIVSPMRTEVDKALKRLAKQDVPSLADSKEFLALQGDEQGRMIFVCFNAKQAMPLIRNLVQVGAGASQEFQMASALLDLDSLRWIALRAGVSDDGLAETLVVRFDEDQNNLVYNFLRTPPLTRSSLRCVPAGAAAFMAVSLSEPVGEGVPGKIDRAKTVRRITGLDLGREFFANIEEKALFVLPPAEGAATDRCAMPDVGLALTVRDPARSTALWTQLLSLPTFATGRPTPEGKATTVADTEVTMYEWPEGITAYFANVDNHVLIALTERALAQSIRAARGGDSVLDDAALKPSLARLGENSSKVLFVHAGRCVQVARAVSGEDLEEIAPFEHLLNELVACFMTDESNSEFRLTAALTGIPEVSDVLEQFVQAQMHGGQAGHAKAVAKAETKAKLQQRGAKAKTKAAKAKVKAKAKAKKAKAKARKHKRKGAKRDRAKPPQLDEQDKPVTPEPPTAPEQPTSSEASISPGSLRLTPGLVPFSVEVPGGAI